MRAATTTSVAAGRTPPNHSAWARVAPATSAAVVRYMRVRTTSAAPAPARPSASTAIANARWVCA
jgi:hypothetical protein